MITIDDFKKVEIKIGKILSAVPVDGSNKLLLLSVDFAEEKPRSVLSGISAHFPLPDDLVGKHCAFVTNLEERIMMRHVSQAMILAAHGEDSLSLFEVPNSIFPGTVIT